MPYYKNLHLLYIHIPKTGGTSVEDYLQSIGGQQTLRNSEPGNNLLHGTLSKVSLQHQTLSTLTKYAALLEIDLADRQLRVFATVRNPYDRAVSDLFWYRLIRKDSTPDEVFRALKEEFLRHPEALDNHPLPQHKFISVCGPDSLVRLRRGVTVLRSETLTDDMRRFGFRDYSGPDTSPTYDKYLNRDSIALINKFYAADFALLGYRMR